MTHPYRDLPSRGYWKTSIATRNMFDINELWSPKFNILPSDIVVSYGSCFAQHFGRALLKKGYKWTSFENAGPHVSDEIAKKFNYNVFSARTANIYTASLLNQWVDWALQNKAPPQEIWEKNGRYFDPFRPTIEPDGFESPEELHNSRFETIKSFKASLESANVFVFTLGLTESWFNSSGGYEYPLCPGTASGCFEPEKHTYFNQGFEYVRNNLNSVIKKIQSINPKIKIILTVSPVPLVATNSDTHILTATTYSKSVLRAVAGQISQNNRRVDYFPSFEIISSHPFKGTFYQPNMREVNQVGVDFVMSSFFECLFGKYGVSRNQTSSNNRSDDVVCEEELLVAFNTRGESV